MRQPVHNTLLYACLYSIGYCMATRDRPTHAVSQLNGSLTLRVVKPEISVRTCLGQIHKYRFAFDMQDIEILSQINVYRLSTHMACPICC